MREGEDIFWAMDWVGVGSIAHCLRRNFQILSIWVITIRVRCWTVALYRGLLVLILLLAVACEFNMT